MSGDSQPYKKKEEESNLLVPDRANITATGATDTLTDVTGVGNQEEKQEFIKRDKEDNQEAAGDTKDKERNSDKDYLENDNMTNKKTAEGKWDSNKGDNVDSVYLRPPPPHKARSSASNREKDEDCFMTCLYYTMQCCDCVLQ